MATVRNLNGAPPPPPPPPPPFPSFLGPSCVQCPVNRRITIQEAFSRVLLPCERCEKATRALSVYMTQQHMQYAQNHLKSDLGIIQQEDEVCFGDLQFSSRRPTRVEIFPQSTPTTAQNIEICIDRESPAVLTSGVNSQDLNNGFLYQNWRHGLSVPWSIGSTESLEWARARLMQCETSHTQCHQAQNHLPKRTLDIRITPETGNDIRLRESSLLETGRYATLSHGWGKQHPPKTLRADVQASMKRIHFNSLSIKFQQVIQFVRQLGIDFLWIDSLCIIQDDEQDKLEQIPRMSEIYTNSVLTIAASQSSDSEGRLFSSKSPFEIGFPFNDAEQGIGNNLRVRKAFPHQMTHYPPLETEATPYLHATFPLLKRAWVFQERILSPRMLHFGENELHWECGTTAACECGIEHASNIKPSIFTLGTPNKPTKQGIPYTIAFARLINYYSNLELSYESDILLALQGIIKQLEGTTGDQNIAGLWKKKLGWNLCWTVVRPSPRRRHAKVPTWSWASVLTPINYEAYEVGQVDADAIVTLAHPHSAPSDFALRLRRRVIRGTSKRHNDRYVFEYSSEIVIPFFADIFEIESEVLCLVEIGPMARTDERRHEFPCLIVHQPDPLQAGVFQRVGRVDLEPDAYSKLFDETIEDEEDICIV